MLSDYIIILCNLEITLSEKNKQNRHLNNNSNYRNNLHIIYPDRHIVINN